jgi:hypothetical protein
VRCGAVSALNCHPLASCARRPAPLRTPSHHPGHVPSHIALTTPTTPINSIAAAASTSKAPHTNAFSPWGGNNTPPEVPKAQECIAGACRRVRAVSAVAAWGGKGELTVLGSEGPLKFLFYFLSLLYYCSTS